MSIFLLILSVSFFQLSHSPAWLQNTPGRKRAASSTSQTAAPPAASKKSKTSQPSVAKMPGARSSSSKAAPSKALVSGILFEGFTVLSLANALSQVKHMRLPLPRVSPQPLPLLRLEVHHTYFVAAIAHFSG